MIASLNTETFEAENFCKFFSFVAVCKSFLCKIWSGKSKQSVKVFSVKIVFSTNSQNVSRYKVYELHALTIRRMLHSAVSHLLHTTVHQQ